MELPNIVDKVKDTFAEKDKRYPCYINRASSLGYAVPELQGCLRRGYYERVAWSEKEPWGVDSLIRFEEGNRQERAVLRDLSEAGIDVIEQQQSFEWPEYQISGHIDGSIIVDGVAVPIEIKSAAPAIFSQINSFEDLDKKSWLRAYKCQITLYMLHKNIDQGIFIFKDKSSGLMKQINVSLDYDLGEACLRTAEAINKHIANKTLPDQIQDRETCKNCPFKHLCLPDIQFGEPLRIVDDPMFEQRLDRYYDLEAQASESKKLYEIVREECKAQAAGGELNMSVGKYLLTGKRDAKGAFRLKIEII